MKIVLDTNVVLSAFFFGGFPGQLLESVVQGKAAVYATREIVEEYEAAVAKMRARKQDNFSENLLLPIIARLHIVEPKSRGALCRDPHDDKFIACAMAANAAFIVSDGKKVSFVGPYRSTKIMTAEAVCRLLALCA